jgi:probable phosphoglycerate mutase
VSRLILLGNFTKNRVETIYLYLCRHGESQYNADGKLQGQLESSLTQLGRQQATLLANKAKLWNINRIISSPLGRAQQTAHICALESNLTVEVQKGFEERHYGEWQGSLLHQLPAFERFKQQCYSEPNLIPCDGVESTANVRIRMAKQLRLLNQTQGQKHEPGNILLISHGDAINCLMSMWSPPINMANTQHVRLVKTTDSYVWDKQ